MFRYSLLRTSEDGEAPLKSPMMHWTQWFAPRKVRYIIVVSLLFILVIIQYRSNIIPVEIKDYYKTYRNDTTLAAGELADAPVNETQSTQPVVETVPTDWSQYAYTQYVTNPNYLCNSVMIFEALHRLESKAERVMLYPQYWNVPSGDGADAEFEGKMLAHARDLYNVKLLPIEVQHHRNKEPTWQDSYTKLLAFNQTQYKRVINVDSDATILQHMDELFFLPPAPVAMPRAFWIHDEKKPNFLSSQILVIEPSEFEWDRINKAIQSPKEDEFDMEIVNNLYGTSCLILPHRRYDLTTGEFRSEEHSAYLGSKEEVWDGKSIFNETKFLHFSDWPYPKPWIRATDADTNKIQPKCKKVQTEDDAEPNREDCTDRDIWLGIYRDFSERRERICGRKWDIIKRRRRSETRAALQPPKFEPIYPMS